MLFIKPATTWYAVYVVPFRILQPKHVKLAQALVICRLDYGNALPCGISLSLFSRQHEGWHAFEKREQISPISLQLHWFPVKYRSWYKILLHTFKIMSGQAQHLSISQSLLLANHTVYAHVTPPLFISY